MVRVGLETGLAAGERIGRDAGGVLDNDEIDQVVYERQVRLGPVLDGDLSVQALLDEAQRRGCAGAWLGTESTNISGQHCFSSVPGSSKPEEFLLYEWNLLDD